MANKDIEKVYEVSFHLIPTIDADAVSGVFGRIREFVAKEGEVLSEESPALRDLAYTIRHTIRQSDGSYSRFDAAYFGSVKFRTSRDSVKRIEEFFKSDEKVLRFLLLETVVEDTRIGEVLPGVEEEEKEDVPRRGGRQRSRGRQQNEGSADSDSRSDDSKGQEGRESGVAEQPNEEGGKKAG